MITGLQRWQRSLFFSQLKTMLTGTVTGQLIMIAVIPVIARLFSPTEFAAYAVVIACAGISSAGAALRYDLSIVLPKEDSQSQKIVIFTIQALLFTTLLLVFLLWLTVPALEKLSYFSHFSNLTILLICWPVFHFIQGLNSIGNYLLTRQNNFGRMATAQIVKSAVTALFFVITGYFKQGSNGLILSSLSGMLIYGLLIWLPNCKLVAHLGQLPDKALLKEYRNFPLFSLPMALLNVFSLDLLLHLLNQFTTPFFTGLYAKAYRVVSLPLSVLTLAFGTVFYQKLNSTTNKIKVYNLAFTANLLIAVIILLPLLMWGEDLFALFLGEQWRPAGRIAAYLFPLTVCCHAAGSVSQVFDVLQKNQAELIWQIGYLIGGILLLWLGSAYWQLDYYQLIKLFALFGALAYLLMYALGLRFLLRNDRKERSVQSQHKQT